MGTLACPPGHVPHLRRLIDDLVHGDGHEVDVHDLGDRAHAGQRRPHRDPHDRRLRDGRFANAVGEGLGNPLRDREIAAVGRDVLADEEHAIVPGHLFVNRLVQGVPEGHGPHDAAAAST